MHLHSIGKLKKYTPGAHLGQHVEECEGFLPAPLPPKVVENCEQHEVHVFSVAATPLCAGSNQSKQRQGLTSAGQVFDRTENVLKQPHCPFVGVHSKQENQVVPGIALTRTIV
eukprot:1140736-Pelagomonas_calceolata.AAC.7